MSRPEDEAPQRSSYLNEMARDECKRAAETGNVLHFFAALNYAVKDAVTARFRAQDKDPAGKQSKIDDISSDLEVLLPQDLCEYLLVITGALRSLSQGLDFRYHTNNSSLNLADWLEAERAFRKQHRVSHDKAAELVAQALYLTRPGYNAFRASQRERVSAWARSEEERLREAGVSPSEAREAIATELGIEDERSYRRFLAGRRRIVRKTSKKL